MLSSSLIAHHYVVSQLSSYTVQFNSNDPAANPAASGAHGASAVQLRFDTEKSTHVLSVCLTTVSNWRH